MGQIIEYEFFEAVFLRAPIYSFEDYALSRMPQVLPQVTFQNALWLASPDFYQLLAAKDFAWDKLAEKERFSLYKYYNRMSFRPTPFGAFSSFSLIDWNEQNTVRFDGRESLLLHLLPSRQWQLRFEQCPMNSAGDELLRTNPTLFVFGNTYRFIKSVTALTGKIKFHVNEIKGELITVFLVEQCRSSAAGKNAFAAKLIEMTGCSTTDALGYLDFLLEEQVLLNGRHQGLLHGYTGIASAGEKIRKLVDEPLSAFWRRVGSMPLAESADLPGLVAELENLMPFPGAVFKKNIFYAGLERTVSQGGIHQDAQEELLAALDLLRRIVIPYPTPALEDFKKAFRQRFEEQRVPLLRALDPDTGISYGGLHTATESGRLLEDLNFAAGAKSARQMDWTAVHRLFLRIWLNNARRLTNDPVVITGDDLEDLDEAAPVKLPPSLAVMFTRNNDRLILDNTGGASALSLLGRFSVFSAEVEALCKGIAKEEMITNPAVVFAEIHQLSDTHTDNINRRTPLYDHVITINTYPADTGQKEVALDDLVLSVRGEELLLESVSLGKRIIPRLPTAYNFHHNDLALFQLLCDLQFQGLHANFTFDLEKLFPGIDFYPRVEYGNTVLSLARWKVSEKELNALLVKPLSLGRLHQFRSERGVPALVSTGLSDQQLIFDLLDDQQAKFFLDCLKEHKTVTIREYINADRSITSSGKAFNGQFIALLKNAEPVYAGVAVQDTVKQLRLQRSFPPGSAWLYVKIYCTPESADKLLVKIIAPFIRAYSGEIAVWFFIRYQDPEPHIRLRIKSKTPDSALLLQSLNNKLFKKPHRELVREIKSETYQREVERYSAELMEATEAFFYAGSNWCLANLKGRGPNGESTSLVPFYLIWLLTLDFLKDDVVVGQFFKWRSASFLKEFGEGKKLKVELDTKYRSMSRELCELIGNSAEKKLTAEQKALERLRAKLSVIAERSLGWPEERRYILLADLLHMQVNRMFASRQRQHEALIYYCLSKYSMSITARKI
jgi:thiopeptide-type bacteriocin biosynthesis protein